MGEEVKLIATPESFPCARIEWALRIKGIEFEYIKEANKSDLLRETNPIHKKIPVLLHNGSPIAESLVILEYLDETWKQNPLLPQDPYQRARARFFAKFIDEKCVPVVWGAGMAQGAEKGKAVESALELLAFLEKKIQLQGNQFFGGEEIGYLDIVAGWIPHWLNVTEQLGEMELLTSGRFPSLHEWGQNFIQTSPIKDCIPPREKLIDYFSFSYNYMRSLATNKP